METEYPESTNRLVNLTKEKSYGQYEYITAMLWMNILSSEIPLNTDESFLYAPEFAREGGRCDLVLSQSGLHPNLPPKIDAMGVPFLAVEFKGAYATIPELRVGRDQTEASMRHIATQRDVGQRIFGMLAWGTYCQFFVWENGFKELVPEKLFNVAERDGRNGVAEKLRDIRSEAPFS